MSPLSVLQQDVLDTAQPTEGSGRSSAGSRYRTSLASTFKALQCLPLYNLI